MGNLNVKNGTPIGNEHLCKGCSNGQFITGYRESEVLVICTNSTPSRVVPFVVHECTDFWDRRKPDWEQMEKLALSFSEGARRKPTPGFRGSGFARVLVDDVDETVDEDELSEVAQS
jgi:hypothetical protein